MTMTPAPADPDGTNLSPAAARAVRRALLVRETAYSEEVQRLLDAGLALMVEGERSPRVADIVSRAGLSNQAFYRHFAGKDELIAAVVEAGAYRLDGYLRAQVERATTPEAQVAAWVRGVLSQARPAVAAPTRAALASLRLLPLGDRERTAIRPGITVLTEVLERLGSPDPERDAQTISLAAFGRLEHFLWESPCTDADVEHLVGFCLGAIGAHRPATHDT
jgi:AcrR family transcriptional regulator